MTDEEFGHPRLAAMYDALDPDRSDLETCLGVARKLGARRVLDVGCGTGALALELSARGCDAVDPAAASLAVARAKPGAQRVCWVEGDATVLSLGDRDLATMSGNTAQAIVDPQEWAATLTSIHASLRPGGHLVLETRNPAARAWERWTEEASRRTVEVPGGVGAVTCWVELKGVDGSLVGFRWTWFFHADGATLTSESTVRFRDEEEVKDDLHAARYRVLDVRGAPERPGLELVFVARRVE